MSQAHTPPKWHTVYRGSEDKRIFVGKDGVSGLIRSKYEWRTTDSLSRESGLSKREVEEIMDYFCNKGVVIQHSGDPEKWGYWENVGAAKPPIDVVAKDHKERADKQQQINSGKAPTKPTLPGGQSTINTPVPGPGGTLPPTPAKKPTTVSPSSPKKAVP